MPDLTKKVTADKTDISALKNNSRQKTTAVEKKAVPKEALPLSQAEKEHLTYLRTLNAYNEYCEKRKKYKNFGFIFIIASALVFLTLMFSLDSKISLLCLWIATVIYCVVLMIRADYKCNQYKELLGIADEYDDDFDTDEEKITERNDEPETVSIKDADPKAQSTKSLDERKVKSENEKHN